MLSGCCAQESSEKILFIADGSGINSGYAVVCSSGDVYEIYDYSVDIFDDGFSEDFFDGKYSDSVTLTAHIDNIGEKYEIVRAALKNPVHEVVYPTEIPCVEDDYTLSYYAVIDNNAVMFYQCGNNTGTLQYSNDKSVAEISRWLYENVKIN